MLKSPFRVIPIPGDNRILLNKQDLKIRVTFWCLHTLNVLVALSIVMFVYGKKSRPDWRYFMKFYIAGLPPHSHPHPQPHPQISILSNFSWDELVLLTTLREGLRAFCLRLECRLLSIWQENGSNKWRKRIRSTGHVPFWCRIHLWFRYVGGFVRKVDDVTAYLAA